MKKTVYALTLSALFGIAFLTSCNSCNKKTNTTTTDATTTDVAEPTYVDTPPDSISTAQANGESANDQASSETSGSSASKPKSGSSKTADQSKSTKGYSAPDGTDAENHDGDQYTRNDQKPQPSGPPIK